MDKEQKIAYVLAQVACMYAELEGMKSYDHFCRARDPQSESLYRQKDYDALPNKYGLGHNDVVKLLLDNG